MSSIQSSDKKKHSRFLKPEAKPQASKFQKAAIAKKLVDIKAYRADFDFSDVGSVSSFKIERSQSPRTPKLNPKTKSSDKKLETSKNIIGDLLFDEMPPLPMPKRQQSDWLTVSKTLQDLE